MLSAMISSECDDKDEGSTNKWFDIGEIFPK